jgi:uncharacterized protein YdhG (YjbR/CyaY superfamily)
MVLAKKQKPTTVKEYINSVPKKAQPKLRELRKIIKELCPNAEEGLKWGMPSFSYQRILVAYAAAKNHIGFYPTPDPIQKFAKELVNYKTSKGAIQFPMDMPLPISLIRKIIKFRVKECLIKNKKWKE